MCRELAQEESAIVWNGLIIVLVLSEGEMRWGYLVGYFELGAPKLQLTLMSALWQHT